jgi:hypothetical protein
MKTWKQSVFFGILAVIALVFAFVGCGDKTDPCNCDPKAHLGIGEKCGCGGSGCNCTEQKIEADDIFIQKQNGVSVEEMNTAGETVKTGYLSYQEFLGGKVLGVIITKTGKEWAYSSEKIVSIRIDKVSIIEDIFYEIGDGTITQGMESQNSN